MSPFCKIAREALCELEIPHEYRAAARGSAKRQELFERRGQFQVPYLEVIVASQADYAAPLCSIVVARAGYAAPLCPRG